MTKVWKGIAEIWGLAKNTAGDSVKSKMSHEIRDFVATREAGFAKILARVRY